MCANNTLLGTNIVFTQGMFESMIFLFPRWDMLVLRTVFVLDRNSSGIDSSLAPRCVPSATTNFSKL